MKSIFSIIMVIAAVASATAAEVTQFYPGKLLRKEVVTRETSVLPEVTLSGCEKSVLALLFTWREREVIIEKPFYEKVALITDDRNPHDPGIHEVLTGEYIAGKLEQRETIAEKGPIIGQDMSYLGVQGTTDALGKLTDDRQVIMQLFDDLWLRHTPVRFYSPGKSPEIITLEITRAQFNEKMGLNYPAAEKSHAKKLDLGVKWERSAYRPGETGKATITATNLGSDGKIVRIQARSMSRWPWLEGKQFYLGDLGPQEEKSFFRYFHIPEDVPAGDYYLRFGVNEHNGAKPQISSKITVINSTAGNKN